MVVLTLVDTYLEHGSVTSVYCNSRCLASLSLAKDKNLSISVRKGWSA